jgi:gluconate 2-dehydrogenase gamma chain
VECSVSQRALLLDEVAWPEKTSEALKPQAAFFNRLRDLTGSAFFSSKMGVHDLRYMGNVPNPNWQGAPKAALDELGVSYAEWDRKYGNPK